MKYNKTLLLLLLTAILSATSCKKEYTCSCNGNDQYDYISLETIKASSHKKAERQCTINNPATDNGHDPYCTLLK